MTIIISNGLNSFKDYCIKNPTEKEKIIIQQYAQNHNLILQQITEDIQCYR